MPAGERHLHGDRADAARAAVDEERVAGRRAQQAEARVPTVSPATPAAAATAQSTDAGLRAQASSTAYSACVFGAAAEHVVADGHAGHALADLVDDAGGVVAEIARTVERLAAGHRAAEASSSRSG